MKNFTKIALLILKLIVIEVLGQQSPCPNIFEYYHNNGIWYGIIELPSPPAHRHSVILKVTLSMRGTTAVS